MRTLADALDFVSVAAGEWSWDVPDGWQQGRGAFGGLTLAALAKCAASALPAGDPRPLRALTGEIPSAVLAEPARLRATVLRSGNALTTVAAELAQRGGEARGEVAAHAVASFGKTREVGFDRDASQPPAFPAFDDAPRNVLDPAPTFIQHFELRVVRGAPLGGEREPLTEGWIRLRAPGDVEPAVALLTMIDAWYPSVLPVLTSWRPFGTISFAAHLFDRGWSPREPLYHRSRLLASQQGYFAELRELFTARGELCAVNQQTMAIIK